MTALRKDDVASMVTWVCRHAQETSSIMALGFSGGLFRRVIEWERQGLFSHFWDLMRPSPDSSLLDLGGPTRGFSSFAERFKRVVVANEAPGVSTYHNHMECAVVRADARRLPFRDSEFDYVFSNATLEHIRREDWPAVSSEIDRVAAKGFFVATPNFWFPFEPHYLLPGFQLAPEAVKRFLLFRLRLKIGHMSKRDYHLIHLPRKRELSKIFRRAEVAGWGSLAPRHWCVWWRL